MFSRLFRRQPEAEPAALLAALIAEARAEAPFRDLGVADTFEGRFEHLALISTLFLERLTALAVPAAPLAQELVDALFTHLDDALRRGGVSDIAVGKRMKKLAKSFYGRVNAYREAFTLGEAALRAALSRNLYGSALAPEAVPAAMLERIERLRGTLAGLDLAALRQGRIEGEK